MFSMDIDRPSHSNIRAVVSDTVEELKILERFGQLADLILQERAEANTEDGRR